MKREYVDFETIKEEYTVCKAENGQILRAKQTVTGIFNEPDENGNPKGTVITKLISNVETTSEIDTANLEYAELAQVTEKDQVKELEFKTLREPTNVYETKNSIILIISHVKTIFLTNKKDKKNNPYLRYVAEHELALIRKPKTETVVDERID